MTSEQAIKTLENAAFLATSNSYQDIEEAVNIAVNAIKKQIPQKLIAEGDGYADGLMVYNSFYCPSCDHCMEEDEVEDYCPNCGQKICWE